MKKRVFIVTGHCDNFDKEYMTLSLLEKIRNNFPDDDIVYASHLNISEKFQKYADYVVYVRENPIENRDICNDLSESFAEFFYNIPNMNNVIKLTIPNHGYAHHMLISGSMRILCHDYEYYHFSNYDIDYDFLIEDLKKRESFCEKYDGFFYEFKYRLDWVNTEIFTINKKIADYISQIKQYKDYTGFISLEEKYTNFLKDKFNIHVEKNNGSEFSYGKVDFKFSRSDTLRYLNPISINFSICPIKQNNQIKIIILHKKQNHKLKLVLHYFQGPETINVEGYPGCWHMLDVKHACIVDVYSENEKVLVFDLNEQKNYGRMIK